MTGDRAPLIAGCTITSASGHKPKLMVLFFSDSYLQVFVFNSPLTKSIPLPWKTLYFSLQAGPILLTSCACMHVCVCTSMCACVCSFLRACSPSLGSSWEWYLPGGGTFHLPLELGHESNQLWPIPGALQPLLPQFTPWVFSACRGTNEKSNSAGETASSISAFNAFTLCLRAVCSGNNY